MIVRASVRGHEPTKLTPLIDKVTAKLKKWDREQQLKNFQKKPQYVNLTPASDNEFLQKILKVGDNPTEERYSVLRGSASELNPLDNSAFHDPQTIQDTRNWLLADV